MKTPNHGPLLGWVGLLALAGCTHEPCADEQCSTFVRDFTLTLLPDDRLPQRAGKLTVQAKEFQDGVMVQVTAGDVALDPVWAVAAGATPMWSASVTWVDQLMKLKPGKLDLRVWAGGTVKTRPALLYQRAAFDQPPLPAAGQLAYPGNMPKPFERISSLSIGTDRSVLVAGQAKDRTNRLKVALESFKYEDRGLTPGAFKADDKQDLFTESARAGMFTGSDAILVDQKDFLFCTNSQCANPNNLTLTITPQALATAPGNREFSVLDGQTWSIWSFDGNKTLTQNRLTSNISPSQSIWSGKWNAAPGSGLVPVLGGIDKDGKPHAVTCDTNGCGESAAISAQIAGLLQGHRVQLGPQTQITADDLNQDGLADLIVLEPGSRTLRGIVSRGGAFPEGQSQDGTGSHELLDLATAPEPLGLVAVGLVDTDALPDLAASAATGEKVYVFRNTTSGPR